MCDNFFGLDIYAFSQTNCVYLLPTSSYVLKKISYLEEDRFNIKQMSKYSTRKRYPLVIDSCCSSSSLKAYGKHHSL
jgi:hypothetical protein